MFDFFKKKPKPEPPKTETAVVAEPTTATELPTAGSATVLAGTPSDAQPEIPPAPEVLVETPPDAQAEAVSEHIPAITSEPLPEPEPVVKPAVWPESRTAEPEQNPTEPSSTEAVKQTVSKSLFARSFGNLFSRNPKLDPELLDELETALITADVGVKASAEIMAHLQKRFKAREFADAKQLLAALRQQLLELLAPIHKPLVINKAHKPFVLLTIGVNGVGKTTTIGKLARRFQHEGHSLMLAAGDTFRAAAVQQLQIWGERNNVVVVAQGQDADPASVAFDALQAAKSRGFDILIADTAGRLHTQTHLMAELSKIKRVLTKVDASAPHEVLLVIDGTTGQNAISQCRAFHEAVGVTGLVVTKLDGSAKGGVLFALAKEFGIPIRFIGLGEKPEDLRAFDPQAYVDALLPKTL
jgi:fused signal recognition particle receptor